MKCWCVLKIIYRIYLKVGEKRKKKARQLQDGNQNCKEFRSGSMTSGYKR